MSAPFVVAVDGPSGSGKSSVSRAVAAHLGGGYLDTGAMYRALTWWCLETGVDLADLDAVAAAAQELPLAMSADPAEPGVLVGDDDVTEAIRTSQISAQVSVVATNPGVRVALQEQQRDLITVIGDEQGSVVAEGRDVTTVVAPDADVRLLLTASEEARLRRRTVELHGAADEQALEATRDEVVRRDRDDSSVSQFLVAADGVLTLDTSEMTFEESVAAAIAAVDAVRSAG
ncbi:(d)CMP kinase [Janibacter melonis]|uniref:(d)CMP kinase n=1 Tax=Janibacter melonis TaxID=262209 RepID=UPI0020943F4E|nr:(d)CMP kinase [Janibacter melonis]